MRFEIISNIPIKKIFLVISFMGQIISFFIPSIIQQLYNNETGIIINGIIFYGYEDFYYYVNFIILLILWLLTIKINTLSTFLIFFVLSILYLGGYIFIMNLGISIPFGESSTLPKVGIGLKINVISTIFILTILYAKVIKQLKIRKKLKINNEIIDQN